MAANQTSAALLLLLVGLAPVVLGLVAVVAGVVARRRVRQSDGTLRGEGLAMAGIICGAITLLAVAGLTALGVAGWAASARASRTVVVTTPAGPGRATPAAPVVVPGPAGEEDPFEEEIIPEDTPPGDGGR